MQQNEESTLDHSLLTKHSKVLQVFNLLKWISTFISNQLAINKSSL